MSDMPVIHSGPPAASINLTRLAQGIKKSAGILMWRSIGHVADESFTFREVHNGHAPRGDRWYFTDEATCARRQRAAEESRWAAREVRSPLGRDPQGVAP